MGEFHFRIVKYDNVFDEATWKRLDKSFRVAGRLDLEEGSGHLKDLGKQAEKEFAFRGRVPGGRVVVEAFVNTVRDPREPPRSAPSYHFDVSVSYDPDYTDGVCQGGRMFYSPVLWESEVDEPIEPTSIAAILNGDHNKDKKTDFLVVLTNGAAYVFQQIPGRLPPTTCEW
jgi:hypothetical protein